VIVSAFAAKYTAEYSADDLPTHFTADRTGRALEKLLPGRGASTTTATQQISQSCAQAVKKATTVRC
jgi:hypothetical protein